METILQVKNLTKTYAKRTVVDRLNLELCRGEVFGFLGPNGAGKTTTIKMITGLLQRDTGEILVDGYDIKKSFEKFMAHIGAIIENPEAYPYMTGMQNLMQYARIRKGVTKERIDEVVRLVGLENRIHDKVKKYSLGMKQRLGVAQAILHRPELLILDEPTNGLDPAGIKELRDILVHLAHEENICVMVSSHLLAEMQMMCDRVGLIANGKLIRVSGVQELVNETAGGKLFRIQIAGDAKKAATLLAGSEITEQAQDTFTISLHSNEEISDILSALVVNQIKVLTVTEISRTLEDIFLELTESGGGNQIG